MSSGHYNPKPAIRSQSGDLLFPLAPQPKNSGRGMQNGRTTKLYHRRFLTIDSATSRIQLFNVLLLVSYYEFDFENHYGKYDDIVFMALLLIAACAVLSVPLVVFRALAKAELDFYQRKTFRKGLERGELLRMGVEIAIMLLQPYWPLNTATFESEILIKNQEGALVQFLIPFKINHALTLLSLIRLYWLSRSHLLSSPYMNPRSSRISRLYLSRADYHYALKSIFKDYPTSFVSFYFLASIMVFSFAIRIPQKYRIKALQHCTNQCKLFDYYTNAVYFVITTMTTVGYGDVSPATSLGRLVCCVLVLWGVLIVSVMVVVLNNTFLMEDRQVKVLLLIRKLELREELRLIASDMIKHVYRWRKFKKEKYRDTNWQSLQLQNFQRKYKKLKMQFSTTYKSIKNINEGNEVYREMSRSFDILLDDLESITHNQDKLINYMHDHIESAENLKAFMHMHML